MCSPGDWKLRYARVLSPAYSCLVPVTCILEKRVKWVSNSTQSSPSADSPRVHSMILWIYFNLHPPYPTGLTVCGKPSDLEHNPVKNVCIYVWMHACMYIYILYIHMCVRVCVCMCICVYVYVYIYIYMHMYMYNIISYIWGLIKT